MLEKPSQTPTHAPNLEECGRYTLYARNPSPHCIGKLAKYFAFPNVKVVLRGLYEMKPKVRSDVEVDVLSLCYFPEIK
ncbi:hypothetical protein [Microcoleus sp. B3-D7]|uniref:hypothetical protein n=1 Tax=Microcoleus sp. B3-D7 TaxID=2818659 RepID=UPI002FCF6A9F